MSLHDQILEILTEKGALGVNALQRELTDVPLSTLQKYLDKQQTYFQKNESRRWDLPERIFNPQRDVENGSNLLNAQIVGLKSTVELLTHQANAILMIAHTVRPTTPVANKFNPQLDIDPSLIAFSDKIKENLKVFKKYTPLVPEQYKDLLTELDLYKLVLDKGRDFLNQSFNPPITALFLEQTDTLPDDLVDILVEYQKGNEENSDDE